LENLSEKNPLEEFSNPEEGKTGEKPPLWNALDVREVERAVWKG
jgi:hypothetical protein